MGAIRAICFLKDIKDIKDPKDLTDLKDYTFRERGKRK